MADTLNIYYATMTGNAEGLAFDAEKKAKAAGWETRTINLADIDPESLVGIKNGLFIVSTWGDGEPPADAEDFFENLRDAELDLSALRYATFGLGDSSYPDFNQFAIDLSQELDRLGANAFVSRVEADLDYDEDFESWLPKLFAELQKELPLA